MNDFHCSFFTKVLHLYQSMSDGSKTCEVIKMKYTYKDLIEIAAQTINTQWR